MQTLIKFSMENQIPIEIIYLSKTGLLSQRHIIVKKIEGSRLLALCLEKNSIRSFNVEQLLSAGKTRNKNWMLRISG
ncbi:hypothetical protein [Metabacillus sp. RGM 3146]|uniref:hypothetical protein n=1 Tax=Metabacillus sp. RGM 3146 TaxID=3401092 RepID=UPI003B9D9C74